MAKKKKIVTQKVKRLKIMNKNLYPPFEMGAEAKP